ncbi:MAG: GNAT family N-acetyltransferase [Clostridiales bacterium]|nr:GNAT family N-acetyltransferase [Clostridiales bacterium]
MLKDKQCFDTILANQVIKSNISPILLVQPVFQDENLDEEYQLIRQLSGRDDFQLVPVPVSDWNEDLAPWPAPPVFGKEPFGDGAGRTLRGIEASLPEDADTVYLGGYSLAGFFALWAAYQTDRFDGVAAVSPSVWYPGWIDLAEKQVCRTNSVYLSLGTKEEKTRNQTMARVGSCIRRMHELLPETSVLEWNEGNHFRDPALRTAKGFAWLLKQAPIRTERLVLRPNGPENLESTFAYTGDRETARWMVHLPHETIEETKDFLEKAAREWRKPEPGYYEFAVWKDNIHIGAVSLYLYDEDHTGELGWIFNKEYQHQGYALEAALALKAYAQKTLRIRRFRAHCDADNAASCRIMERLGMHKVSTHGGRYNKLSAEERMEYMYES